MSELAVILTLLMAFLLFLGIIVAALLLVYGLLFKKK